MKANRGGEGPEHSGTAAGRGRVAFSVPHRGPVITHILRSPTVKINLSSDPGRPHPLASLRAAPVLADAVGRRRRTAARGEEGRSAVLHHQTGLLQQNNTLQEGEKKKNQPHNNLQSFLEGKGGGGDNAVYRTLRQDGGERAPWGNLCAGAEGWEEGTKDEGRHRRDLW